MNQIRNMEDTLATLGQARQAGVFSTASAAYPWKTAATRRADQTARRFGWVRVAVPLAAAAAVAVLFVGPNLMKSRQVQDIAQTSPINLPSATANQMADAGKPATSAATFDCDYNGDGVVDGRDIQAFVNRLKDMQGDPLLQAEYLQRCLLGN
jgi:hypothetical protein